MFCTLLKQLRNQKGISQTELAKAIGVSPGNVGDWERGRSKPGYDALQSLAHFFAVSADYLLEIEFPLVKKSDGLTNADTPKITCDEKPLDEIEIALISMFRLLPSYVREEIFDIIYFMHKKHVEKKKESIYWTFIEDEKEQQRCEFQRNADDHSGTA